MFKDRILTWLNNYKTKTNCRGVVLGISGGKDSTVCAMLAKKIWGNNMLGIIMPNGIQKDIDDAIQVCKVLDIPYKIVNIEKTYNEIIKAIEYPEDFSDTEIDFSYSTISDKAKTNIPPRLRMTALYAVAQTLGYRVMGTGNASERFIGWFTKWGDGAHDFNPLAHLRCSEVIELGLELCTEYNLPESLIIKKPADGLTGKSDEENFGFTYNQLDTYIEEYTSGNQIADLKIEQLHKLAEHKLRMPYIISDKF